jgi:hypothetical protein
VNDSSSFGYLCLNTEWRFQSRTVVEQERKARALLGFMDEQDALNFLKVWTVPEGKTDEEFKAFWKRAKSEVELVAPPDLTPEVLEIDDRFHEQLDAIAKDPLFPEAVQQKKWSFKLVEIDKLVCFQKFIYTDHAEDIGKGHDFSDTSKLIDFCLTEKGSKRPFAVVSSPQEYTILSPSQDLRVIGPTQAMQDPTTKRSAYGFGVGWGIPFVQVVEFKDRYFLRNGYHRVYAVRKMGGRHVPCVLIKGETFADLGVLTTGFFGETLLLSDKPPTFGDFFSDGLAPRVRLKAWTKIVRIRAEESMLPVVLPDAVLQKEEPVSVYEESKPKGTAREDFQIQKEDWNVYKLSDGTTLKLRQILIKMSKPTVVQPGQPNFQVEPSTLLMATLSPTKLKGAPDSGQYTPEELSTFVAEGNMKFKTIRAIVNEYLTTSGIKILLQLAQITVGRTSKFDANGDPRYLVNAQISIQIVPPAKNLLEYDSEPRC